jgi:lysozyme
VRISDDGLALVMAFEGCLKPVPGRPGFFKPYLCPAGVLTIGWGHTNHHDPKFTRDAVWSRQQCDDALRGDLVGFEKHVLKHVKVSLAQHEFDALVSWAYNTGGPASAGVWRALNGARRRDITAELAKWTKGGGKVLGGLVRRRKAEGLLFDGKIDQALKVAGAPRSTKSLDKRAAAAPVSIPPPPDVEPTSPAPPKRGWLAAIVTLFRKARP